MEKLTLYLFLLVCICGKDTLCKRHAHKVRDDGGKIVGGNVTSIETYPYQAYLLLYDGRDNYQCGGSIISQYYILTAAHCLARIQSIKVRIGSAQAFSGGLEYETTTFYSHPFYDDTTYDYDVGIVEITDGMTLDGISARTISMVGIGSDVAGGETIVLTGWGATSEGGNTSTDLMVVSVPAVNRTTCNDLLGGRVTDRMFCAGLPEGGKDSCQGDSGGPAVVQSDGLLAGITSFGFGCARPNSPGVYSRIGNIFIRVYIALFTRV